MKKDEDRESFKTGNSSPAGMDSYLKMLTKNIDNSFEIKALQTPRHKNKHDLQQDTSQENNALLDSHLVS